MCTPNPTVAIVTFWQGIVEIILRVAVIVSLLVSGLLCFSYNFIQQEQEEVMGARNFALLFAIGLQQPELLCTCHCQVATLIPMLLGARLSSSYAYFYCSVFAHVSVERFPLTTVR